MSKARTRKARLICDTTHTNRSYPAAKPKHRSEHEDNVMRMRRQHCGAIFYYHLTRWKRRRNGKHWDSVRLQEHRHPGADLLHLPGPGY
jgi:hypothetical protein